MQSPFFLFIEGVGGSEVVLIMVVILIFFGADKIPELARGLGKGIREFKDASTEIRREFEQAGQPTQPNSNYGSQNHYPAQNNYSAPVAETGSGFDPWATPAAASAPTTSGPDHSFEHKTTEPAPPVAHSLPPNLAPEGTQPRQPYIPASPDA
ncbi:Sec-independent protein translocase subunit TatA/TatB [Hymenobacter terrenus]|uniref:Sec-independent protein translocase subunit TatA/TatB n=1 Tax=Hymenobacter terrenus TaxID=1629124 RepID=UPI0009E4A7FD|nr:twin-arginine translocase TatA/TatE family subunit [Hymenobacter terrenus]